MTSRLAASGRIFSSDDLEAAGAELDEPAAEAKREARRAAGAAFLDQAQRAAAKGQDPFAPSQHSTAVIKEPEDPDVVAFGRALKLLRGPVLSVGYVACAAFSPVFIKGSLYSMRTPAVLLFLHMLSAVGALIAAAHYDLFKLNQLTFAGLKGCAVRAGLWALQTLCVFSTLHHCSVLFALTWSLVGRQAIIVGVDTLLTGHKPDSDTRLALGIAGGAAVLELLLDTDKVWVGGLMMALWSAAMACEAVWTHLKNDPTLGGRITDYRVLGVLRDIAEEEDALTRPNMAVLQHTVLAVPVLLLGFLALEGRELVHHELSVPAVTVMLLACATYVGAVGCDLLLHGRVPVTTRQALRAGATLGSLLLFFMEEIGSISWAAVLCSVVACVAAHALGSRPQSGPPGTSAAHIHTWSYW